MDRLKAGMVTGSIGVLVVAVAGCGGGGTGGGVGVSGYTGPTERISFDSQEQAKGAYASADNGTGVVSPEDVAGTALKSGSGSAELGLTSLARGLVERALEDAGSGSSWNRAAETETRTCSHGGQASLTTDVANNQQPSAGDVITFSFDGCKNAPDMMFDGGFEVTVGKFTESSTSGDLDASFTIRFNNLRRTTAGGYVDLAGSATLAMMVTGTAESLRLSGSSLVATSATEQSLLADFDFYHEQSGTNMAQSYDFVFASTEIGGSIEFDTTEMFRGTVAGPTSGQAVITGAGEQKVRLTALSDATNVYVEYDLDPVDGIYETTETVTWSEL